MSPKDRSFEKFDFYFAHGTKEIFIIDPPKKAVSIYSSKLRTSGTSEVLSVHASDLAAAIDWP